MPRWYTASPPTDMVQENDRWLVYVLEDDLVIVCLCRSSFRAVPWKAKMKRTENEPNHETKKRGARFGKRMNSWRKWFIHSFGICTNGERDSSLFPRWLKWFVGCYVSLSFDVANLPRDINGLKRRTHENTPQNTNTSLSHANYLSIYIHYY